MIEILLNEIAIRCYSLAEIKEANVNLSDDAKWIDVLHGQWHWYCDLNWGEVMQANGWRPGDWDSAVPQGWFDEQIEQSKHHQARILMSGSQAYRDQEGYTKLYLDSKREIWAKKGLPKMSNYQIIYQQVVGASPNAFWDCRKPSGPIWKDREKTKLTITVEIKLATQLTIMALSE